MTKALDHVVANGIRDLTNEELMTATGGRMKLPFQQVNIGGLLTSPDGEPVSVYVDGLLVNSVSDGFFHVR